MSVFACCRLTKLIRIYKHPQVCTIVRSLTGVSKPSDFSVEADTTAVKNVKTLVERVFYWNRSVSTGITMIDNLEKDDLFKETCSTICDSLYMVSDSQLISLLDSFFKINLSPSSRVVRYLENDLLWRSRKLPLKLLLKALSVHYPYQETDQQKKLVEELLLYCQSRLDEAQDCNDVIQLMKHSKYFTADCINRIEETALQMITGHSSNSDARFGFDSLCYLLVLLAQAKRRPTPLIRAAVNQMVGIQSSEIDAEPSHIIQMISALNVLRFPDENILKKSTDYLCDVDFLQKINSSSKRELLVSISQLNWSYRRLLEYFNEKLIGDVTFTFQDIITFILTSARLNYSSTNVMRAFNKYVLPKLDSLKTNSPNQWLNTVWSLAILGCATPDHFESVLNGDFYSKVTNNCLSIEENFIKLKLLNIKGVAEIEENCNFQVNFETFDTPKRPVELESFQSSIINSLNSFLPKEKYSKFDIITPQGFTIDAEFIVNSSIKPLPLDEFGVLAGNTSNSVKTLPPGFKRIAIIVVGYNDTLIGNSGLIGIHELSSRLLNKLGYTVIFLRQNDISAKTTAIKKAQYLQRIISDAIKSS